MKWNLTHALYGTQPWEVQAEGMRRSEDRAKFFYALEQGLGKTPLTLNDFINYRDAGKVDLAVAMAPQSFKMDWTLAPEEWGHGDMPTYMWPNCKAIPLEAETGLIAINYEATRGKAMAQLQELFEKRRVMFIIDESSVIKNPQSQMTNSIIDLCKIATMVRELNGTPQTQGVMDWYPQLRAVGALNGMNPYQFRNRHAVMGGYMGKQIKLGEIRNADELFDIIDSVTFRALKKDWRKDLPPQKDQTVKLEMVDAQRRAYMEMLEEFYTEVKNVAVEAEMVLTQMAKLQQISSGFARQGEDVEWIIPPDKNPKVRATLDLIQGKKSIVVYQNRPTGIMLLDQLEKAGLHPARIMGKADMDSHEIVANKKRFNSDPECRVILCQEQAACMGHTLLGTKVDRCSRMVFFENSMSLRDRLQMRDRNHRGEQDEPCDYYDLVCSPIENITINTLQGKRDAADAVDDVIRAVNDRKQWMW